LGARYGRRSGAVLASKRCWLRSSCSKAPVDTKKPAESKQGDGQAGGHTVNTSGGDKSYGAHATMPLLAADKYAEVVIPDLKEFNPDDIKIDSTIVACGKRRTGKSWVFRNLMVRACC
jgi:hypothetical protein